MSLMTYELAPVALPRIRRARHFTGRLSGFGHALGWKVVTGAAVLGMVAALAIIGIVTANSTVRAVEQAGVPCSAWSRNVPSWGCLLTPAERSINRSAMTQSALRSGR